MFAKTDDSIPHKGILAFQDENGYIYVTTIQKSANTFNNFLELVLYKENLIDPSFKDLIESSFRKLVSFKHISKQSITYTKNPKIALRKLNRTNRVPGSTNFQIKLQNKTVLDHFRIKNPQLTWFVCSAIARTELDKEEQKLHPTQGSFEQLQHLVQNHPHANNTLGISVYYSLLDPENLHFYFDENQKHMLPKNTIIQDIVLS